MTASFAAGGSQGRETLPTPGDAPQILLLMRLPLGDTLFATPTIRALRQRYPAALLTALVSSNNAPLLSHNPDLDDAIVLPFRADRGRGNLLATLRLLRRRRYDVALCLGTPALGWLPVVCGIPEQEFLDFAPLWWLFPHDYTDWNRQHAVDLTATVARHLDIGPVEHQLVVNLTPDERAAARALLRRLHLEHTAPLVAIHPGSGAAPGQKRWPLWRFAEVATALAHGYGARIIVLGGPSEVDLGEHLAGMIGPAATCLSGQLDLRETLSLLGVCDLFVGNDSGPLHMATAVGTPVVGIYGPTDPVTFGPCAPPERAAVVQPPGATPVIHFVGGDTIWRQLMGTRYPYEALARLSADPVIAACGQLLAQQRTARRAAV